MTSVADPQRAGVGHDDERHRKDVRIVDTPDVTGLSYQEQDRINLAFDDIAGTFSGSSVQSNRKLNETVGGMNLITANSNQIAAYRLRTFVEMWATPVLAQVGDDQSLRGQSGAADDVA